MTNEDFLESISQEGEIWKPVVGWEDYYIVSNMQRIVFLGRTVKNGNGVRNIPPKLCKPTIKNNGYLYIDLWANNKRRREYIHRIVAMAWIDNPNGYTQIDHRDGNRVNNSIENLRWCTYAINNSNPISKMKYAISRVEDKTKSVEIACVKDGILLKVYPYAATVADDDFSPACVRLCLHGKMKSHKGFQWMRLSDYENLNINNVNVLLESGEE